MCSSSTQGDLLRLTSLVSIGMLRRRYRYLVILFFCCYIFIHIVRQQGVEEIGNVTSISRIISKQDDVNDLLLPAVRSNVKTILYWNTFFGKKDFTFGFGKQPFVNAKCPVSTCYVTGDRSLFNQSDVVIFSIQGMNLTDLPTHRFPHQRFVFFEMESPATTDYRPLIHNRTRFGFFNWTMTYRLDSDIVHRDSYGIVLPIQNNTMTSSYPKVRLPRGSSSAALHDRKDSDELVNIASKKKLVVWFVSHCVTSNRREDYVKELSKYIPVDIYGKCGNLTCTNRNQCKEMMRKNYKFYIAFENSLCTDYVTEKLATGLIYDTVPIVMGSVDYSKFAPPHSFIDVNDFSSPKQLASYLLLLNEMDSLYMRYFDWKRDFTVHLNLKLGWCHLCKLAHRDDRQVTSTTYKDILEWWVRNNPVNCSNLPKNPNLLSIPL